MCGDRIYAYVHKKKILVFAAHVAGVVFRVHTRGWESLQAKCVTKFSYNTNFVHLSQRVKSSSSHAHVAVVSPDESQKFLRKYLSEGDTVLFKGKEAQAVLTLLGEKTV